MEHNSAPFYLKVNRYSDYTLMCIQQWVDVAIYLGREIIIISDNPQLNNSIEKHIRPYSFVILPGRQDELIKLSNTIVEEKWIGAACAHLLPIIHSKSKGVQKYWAIDADDTQFMLKTERIAELIEKVEQAGDESDYSMISLDVWYSRSNNKHWTFGIVYANNNFCIDDINPVNNKKWNEYRISETNITIDLYFTFLRKEKVLSLGTFYVNNVYFAHYGQNFITKAGNCSLYFWNKGHVFFPICEILYGVNDPRCKYKISSGLCIDISSSLEESQDFIKHNVINYGNTGIRYRSLKLEVIYAKLGDPLAIAYLQQITKEQLLNEPSEVLEQLADLLLYGNITNDDERLFSLCRIIYEICPEFGTKYIKLLWKRCNTSSDMEMVSICNKHLLEADEYKYYLSCAYRDGRGVVKDYNEAVYLLDSMVKSTTQSILDEFDILWKINTGDSTRRAFELIYSLRDSSDSRVLSRIGRAFYNAKGVARNLKEAGHYMGLAAAIEPSWGNYYCRILVEINDQESLELLHDYIRAATAEIDNDIISDQVDLFNESGIVYNEKLAKILKKVAKKYSMLVVCYRGKDIFSDNMGQVVFATLIISKSRHVVCNGIVIQEGNVCTVSSPDYTVVNIKGQVLLVPCDSILVFGEKEDSVDAFSINYSECILRECTNVQDNFNLVNDLLKKYNPFCIGFGDYYTNNIDKLKTNVVKEYNIGNRSINEYFVKKTIAIKPQLDIVICSTSQIVDYVYVLLYSIRENNYGKIDIWILQSDYSPEQCSLLTNYSKEIGLDTHIVDVDPSDFDNVRIDKNWPIQICFYLNAHNYLPKRVKRALYLDVDIIVVSDIHQMYYSDFEDSFICACNLNNKRLYNGKDDPRRVMYYNGGVVLLNLEKMRSESISIDTYAEMIDKQHINTQWGDQGLINAMFWEKSKLLPAMFYNYSPMRYDRSIIDYFNYNENMTEAYAYQFETDKYPTIVHFTSGKPWNVPIVFSKNGKIVTAKNKQYPYENKYVVLWWEYLKYVPDSVQFSILNAPKDVRNILNIKELCTIVANYSTKTYSWAYEYCIRILMKSHDYQKVEKIMNNIPESERLRLSKILGINIG